MHSFSSRHTLNMILIATACMASYLAHDSPIYKQLFSSNGTLATLPNNTHPIDTRFDEHSLWTSQPCSHYNQHNQPSNNQHIKAARRQHALLAEDQMGQPSYGFFPDDNNKEDDDTQTNLLRPGRLLTYRPYQLSSHPVIFVSAISVSFSPFPAPSIPSLFSSTSFLQGNTTIIEPIQAE